jgi:hypothetical protein
MNSNNSSSVSLNEIIQSVRQWLNFLKRKFIIILVFSFLAGIVGYIYARFQPIKYIANTTFILEEGKTSNSGLGGLASIAGQFGMDFGSGTGGGILAGDNILVYFKSPSLAREVLMTRFDSTSDLLFADIYAQKNGLKENWLKDDKIGVVDFKIFNKVKKFDRIYDSLLTQMTDEILSNEFSVSRPDKKASFIEVRTKMIDEKLAKNYCDQIVRTVVTRYLNLKTQRQKNTVDKLQLRADSIAKLLQIKTFSGADLQNTSSTMDINPLYKTKTNVAVETTIRDKALLASIFSNVIQNLEMAKFTLSQETPVMQIIDSPSLPLKVERHSKLKTAIVFSILGFLVTVFYSIVGEYFRKH